MSSLHRMTRPELEVALHLAGDESRRWASLAAQLSAGRPRDLAREARAYGQAALAAARAAHAAKLIGDPAALTFWTARTQIARSWAYTCRGWKRSMPMAWYMVPAPAMPTSELQ